MIAQLKSVDDIATIKGIIDAESTYFKQGDYENWACCLAKTALTYYARSASPVGQYSGMEAFGWQEVSTKVQEEMESLPAHKYLGSKSDFNFKIMEDMAFVTFLVDHQFAGSCVLEKTDSQWFILRMSY